METKVRKPTTIEKESAIIEENDFINNLPPECLLHIFSFLTVEDRVQSSRVCKRWEDFGYGSRRDVKKLDLIILEKFQTEHRRLLEVYGAVLRELTISVHKNSNIIRIATTNCPNLIKIRVRFEYCRDDRTKRYKDIRDRTQHCKDLEGLFEKNKGSLRSVVIDNIGKELAPRIHCLFELTEELIELQLWGFKAHLEIDKKERVTRFAPFIPVIRRLKNLEILVLNGLDVTPDGVRVIKYLNKLRYLEIYRSGHFYDKYDISCCRKLEYLSLQNTYDRHVSWINNLVWNNPGLKQLKLNVCDFNEQTNRRLFQLNELETLSLICCLCDTDFDLSGFRNLRRLIAVCLRNSGLIALMETAPRLEFINLTGSVNSPEVLTKAHEVTSRRVNNLPLHIVIMSSIIQAWKRPEEVSPLLIVESSEDYRRRTDKKYNGYNVELSH